MGIEEER